MIQRSCGIYQNCLFLIYRCHVFLNLLSSLLIVLLLFTIQLEQENYDFFPMNRALCLSTIDIDSTESKIDDLLHQVTSIAQKQRDDVSDYYFLTCRLTFNMYNNSFKQHSECILTLYHFIVIIFASF